MNAADALRDVATLGGFFALSADATDTATGGLTPEEFAGLARTVNDRYVTDDARIGVSVAHLGLAARLCSPVLARTPLHGVVPDLTTVTWADGGTAVRLAHLTDRPVADLPSAVGAVYAQLTGPPAAVERALPAKVAPRPLDGNLASALVGSAGVLLRARPDLRAPLTEPTTALLDTGRLRGTGRITGPGLSFRRHSCCLYYRVSGGGKCGDCCLS